MSRPGIPVAGASVLVTGASSGIGAALAVELARRGARGRASSAGGPPSSTRWPRRCREAGADTDVHIWVQDLGDLDAAEALALDAWDRFGGLDVLVNNAAIPMVRSAADLTVDELTATMRVDFESPVRMAMAVLPRMLERDRGMIVNVSSLGGRLGIPQRGGLLRGEVRPVRVERGGGDGPVVDRRPGPAGASPGPIDTDIWDRPGTEPSAYDGPEGATRARGRRHRRAHRGRPLRDLPPRHEGHRRVQDERDRPLPRGRGGDGGQHRRDDGAATGGCREGARLPDRPRARWHRPAARRPPARAAPRHHADEGRGGARPDAARRRLGRAAHPAHRHLRQRLQAGPDGLRRRGRQPDDRAHLLPPGAGPRGGGRGGRGRPGGDDLGGRPAGRAQPVAVVRARGASTRSARPARSATCRPATTSPTAGWPPASTPATRPTPPAASPSTSRPTSRWRSRCPTTCPTRWPCWPTRSRCRSTPSPATRHRPAAGSSSTAPARSARRRPPSCGPCTPTCEVATVARWPAQAALAGRLRRPGVRPRAAGRAHRGDHRVVGRRAALAVGGPAARLPRPTSTSSTTRSARPRPSRSACGCSATAARSCRWG